METKTKEKTAVWVKDAEGQTEQPSFLPSRGQIKMEKDSPGSSKHAKVKLEPREG